MDPAPTVTSSDNVMDYAGTSSAPPHARRGGWLQALLALVATLVYPGLGHMAVGRMRRGLAFLLVGLALDGISVACLITPALLPALPILLVILVGLSLVTMSMVKRCRCLLDWVPTTVASIPSDWIRRCAESVEPAAKGIPSR